MVGIKKRQIVKEAQWFKDMNNCSCCYALHNDQQWPDPDFKWRTLPAGRILKIVGNGFVCTFRYLRWWIKKFVDHRIFQQGILLAILVNTLSMGIEYHNQVCYILFYYISCIFVNFNTTDLLN